MNQMIGADVTELRQLAAQFTAAANQLRATAGRVDGGIRISAWMGPVAIRFRLAWDNEHSRAVKDVADALDESGRRLAREASQQEAASSADTGSTVPMRGPGATGSTAAPASARDLWQDVKRTGEDGVRVVEVTDDDGTKRYIVYVGGSHGWDPRKPSSWWDNAPATFGTSSVTEAQVLKAMESIPSDAEIMMVGYSQGGIHAENIAADGRHKITTLVTFGSPNSPSSMGNAHGVDVVRFVDARDVVPLMDGMGGSGAAGQILRNGVEGALPGHGSNELVLGGHNYAEINPGKVHGEDGAYAAIADDFDDSDAPAHDRSKESMGRFLGGTAREVG